MYKYTFNTGMHTYVSNPAVGYWQAIGNTLLMQGFGLLLVHADRQADRQSSVNIPECRVTDKPVTIIFAVSQISGDA